MIYTSVQWLNSINNCNVDMSLPDSIAKYCSFSKKVGCSTTNIEQLNLAITNRMTQFVLQPTSKIIFAPTSDYPRYKLTNTKLVKKLKYDKTDVIIHDPNCNINTLCKECLDILLIHSPSTSTMYAIPLTVIAYITRHYTNAQLLVKNNMDSHQLATSFMGMAISEKFIPDDCVELYFGNIVTFNEKLAIFFDHIFNKNTPIIPNSQLDDHVNKTLPKLNDEQFKELESWLSSTDENVVNMGITLLTSHDISDDLCRIGTMLHENYNKIRYTKGFKNTGFKQLVTKLGTTPYDLQYRSTINKIYNISNNDLDKNRASKMIEDRIIKYLNKELVGQLEVYSNMNINIQIKSEDLT